MLVQSFIDNAQIAELLAWGATQNVYQNDSVGQHGFFSRLDQLSNHPKCINAVRAKCLALVNGVYQEPVFKDFMNEVFPTGFVTEHTDPCPSGFRHLRCNIMLQKPERGGVIHIGGEPMNLEVGDMLVVDTSVPHYVSRVEGNTSYKTIVFGFLCHE